MSIKDNTKGILIGPFSDDEWFTLKQLMLDLRFLREHKKHEVMLQEDTLKRLRKYVNKEISLAA